MLTAIKTLFGAGGTIAGLLPWAPWLIAAVLGIAGAGGWLWQTHQLDTARADTAKVALERDAAYTKVGVLQGALSVDEATINALRKNDTQNDALIEQQQSIIDSLNQKADDATTAIRKLQNENADVNAYLGTRIPDALRVLLNNEPAGSAASSAD